MNNFVHLRVHTEYSLVDSLLRVDALVDAVAEQRMPACAITDQGNVSALVKFYKPALSRGVKPIVGADIWVAESLEDREPSRLTLLCQNRAGFKRLERAADARAPCKVRSAAATWCSRIGSSRRRSKGLIGLSGGQHGELGKALAGGRGTRGSEVLDYWQKLLPGRYYIELQRLGRAGEREYLARAVEAAAAHSVPVVATNDVCFLARSDFEAHETRVCIAQGVTLDDPGRARTYSEEQYLRSPAEMAELFADLPEALANTVEIAKRCSLEVDVGRVYLPDFVADDRTPPREFLAQRAASGLDPALRRAWHRTRRRAALPRAARARDRGHLQDGLRGLLPHRRRLHRVGARQRHSRRTGSRLRRRLARRLCARHHESRPARARSLVRAVLEPRARVAAGLRHRLLHRRPRPRDRLRRPALRPRARRADRDLRHDGGARRRPRRRARARHAVRLRRPHREADSVRDRHHARQGDRRRRGAARRLSERRGGARAHRSGASASKGSRATSARMPAAS